MDIGSRLPMNPWLFIALGISLTAIGAWGIQENLGWAGIADAAFLALQLAWILQAGLYASSKAEQKSDSSEKRAKRLMIGALICAIITWSGVVLSFPLFANPETGNISGAPALPFVLAMFVGLAGFFTLIFQAAKALCVAEEKNTGERKFVTFLLFLYLIIGAPFLFRRLKRLEPAKV